MRLQRVALGDVPTGCEVILYHSRRAVDGVVRYVTQNFLCLSDCIDLPNHVPTNADQLPDALAQRETQQERLAPSRKRRLYMVLTNMSIYAVQR